MASFLTDGRGPDESYIGGPIQFDSADFINGRFVLVTSPIPLGRVEVFFNVKNALWYQRLLSASLSTSPAYAVKAPKATGAQEYRQAAIEHGARVAARWALSAWRTDFTGAQRYAMGHGKCPYVSGCSEPHEVGTIWCSWHPGGKRRK